jgi:hypothetical protein
MKAIMAFDGLPKLTLNVAAIQRFFYLTYLMSPDTVYNEVRQLERWSLAQYGPPSASFLRTSRKEGKRVSTNIFGS